MSSLHAAIATTRCARGLRPSEPNTVSAREVGVPLRCFSTSTTHQPSFLAWRISPSTAASVRWQFAASNTGCISTTTSASVPARVLLVVDQSWNSRWGSQSVRLYFTDGPLSGENSGQSLKVSANADADPRKVYSDKTGSVLGLTECGVQMAAVLLPDAALLPARMRVPSLNESEDLILA